MQEKLIQIIKHYGIYNQLKYIHSEYFELDESIIVYEESGNALDGHYQEHIAEEIADVMVMLKQFQYFYDISDDKIGEIMWNKIERQLERIKSDNN